MALGRRLARRKPRGRVRREEADEAAAALEEERIDLEAASSAPIVSLAIVAGATGQMAPGALQRAGDKRLLSR